MQMYYKLSLMSVFALVAVSCSQTTEKYAQKEHGKTFGIWEMNYNAGDYDVYWPSLKLTDEVEGALCEVDTERNWWTGAIIRRDTTRTAANMGIWIYSVKSKNDARYYNSVRFRVANSENKYRPRLDHKFIINEGQRDSVSFTSTSNSDDFFVPERAVSERIVELLSENRPVNVKVICEGSDYEGVYSFEMEGSSKLKPALKLNEERKIIANEEFSKADAKAEKEFMKLFE